MLTTPEGGKVVVDTILLSLWQYANGKSFSEITSGFCAKMASPLTVATGLACLVEAGLLWREVSSPELPADTPAILCEPLSYSLSAIIVAYNGINWLPACLNSLVTQSFPCQEIIVVDNASSDGTPDWVRAHFPEVRLIELCELHPFAAAINAGMASARGAYLLVLNQDIWMDADAAACLMAAASHPNTAAVAANLRFMWEPQFLNGIGNEVRTLNWGSDNFIGYLDLGQFSDLEEVPSVCFAAALIQRTAWEEVGGLDEGFLMYYEDVDWSYRARLKGYQLRAAPQALVFHAFGGGSNRIFPETSPQKLKNVVYGRLRFIAKMFNGWRRAARLIGSGLLDLADFLLGLVTLRFERCSAIFNGWKMAFAAPIPLWSVAPERQAEVFARWQRGLPPHIWRGLPELTWQQVCCDYLPWMVSGKTRPIPEFSLLNQKEKTYSSCGWLARTEILWQGEGIKAVLRAIWRGIIWFLG